MRRRAMDRSEAFAINKDPERWLTISERGTTPDRFLADGCEAGYVWDEHMVSVGNKPVRKPKADGWYEHGQVCMQYLELNFGARAADADVPIDFALPAKLPDGRRWAGWRYRRGYYL